MTVFWWIILGIGVVAIVIVLFYFCRDTKGGKQRDNYWSRKTFGHEE